MEDLFCNAICDIIKSYAEYGMILYTSSGRICFFNGQTFIRNFGSFPRMHTTYRVFCANDNMLFTIENYKNPFDSLIKLVNKKWERVTKTNCLCKEMSLVKEIWLYRGKLCILTMNDILQTSNDGISRNNVTRVCFSHENVYVMMLNYDICKFDGFNWEKITEFKPLQYVTYPYMMFNADILYFYSFGQLITYHLKTNVWFHCQRAPYALFLDRTNFCFFQENLYIFGVEYLMIYYQEKNIWTSQHFKKIPKNIVAISVW